MEIEVGGAGSCYSLCSNAQQQQHSRQTPNHFQGQSPCCGGGGGRGGRGFQAGSEGALLTTREHEFAQQHKYHHHKQQQQQQQQQQLSQHSYHLQTPLEQKLGLSRALLTSMQKPKNSPEQGPCLAQQQQQQRQANDDDASGSPSRTSRPVGEFHRFSGMYHNGARQIVNTSSSNDGQQADEGNTSPLVLVSKSTLSNLTEQIAFSMNKMKDLEEQVRVIPELQRRLDNVISDTSSSVSGIDSRSSHIELKDSKYFDNNNDSTAAAAEHIINNCNSSGSNRIIGNNLRRGSLTDRSDGGHPFKAMLSSSLRQPYGGSMRCPSGARANGLAQQQQQQQQSSLDHLARSSSVSIGSPFTNGQRYFDRLIRTNNNNSANNGRQSLEMSKALRSTQDSLNSSTNLGPSAKVEYEDLINDLISLSYSVNYLSSNSNSAHSQSSSAGGGGGSSSNHSQVKETHGNKLERPDAIPAYARRHFHSSGNSRQHLTSTQPSNSSNTYHQHHLHSHNNNNNNNNHHHFNQNSTFNASMSHLYSRDNNNSNSYLSRNYGGSGSLSLQTTPVKTQLDCGCQSFKEHLKYNSISREQRLNSAKSHQAISSHSNNSSNNVSPQPSATASTATSANQKVDASTNTDLNMDDIVTKVELNKLVVDIQKTYPATTTTSSSSAISQTGGGQPNRNSIAATRANNISTSPSDAGSSSSSSGSATGPNSSSPAGSRSMSSGDDLRLGDGGDEDDDQEVSDENGDDLKTNSSASARDISDDSEQPKSGTYSRKQSGSGEELSGGGNGDDGDEDDEEEIEVNGNSINGAEEAYSLGSSYQDPSDFEEYCAYGESLDRRTKDFMSQTTKIPNDLRFALIRLNDSIKKKRPFSQIEASSNCIDVIRKEWFEVAASRDAQAIKTKLYVDYFESFTKQLLNMVVNLTDSAGNTAMHYAASHFKLDIIRILLGTKVCDVNCRNKAGYTPIMLLALAELDGLDEQEVARHLFSMGDVNIKARSSGQTALMLAASHGRVSTCKLLLECGADPSLQDYDGSTALMCGSELGNEDVVSCLLAHKLTDPNATDNDGLDALTIAMNNGHKNIGLILYAAKNVPRMTRSSIYPSNPRLVSSASGYLGASLRRSRGKSTMNHVKRADSLLGQRHGRSSRQLEVHHM